MQLYPSWVNTRATHSRQLLLEAFKPINLSDNAQTVEVNDAGATAPEIGKPKADKYFQKRKGDTPAAAQETREASAGGSARFLSVHLGTYIDDQAYRWGNGQQENIGQLNIGVTYRYAWSSM